ncbi:hypothetical protein LWU69_05030 [Enterobacter hormaechei]|nr:hypothetical protein [Enterobacter hormaechei]MCE1453195.1 hypothetical protein [Enterobacter hormaechei]
MNTEKRLLECEVSRLSGLLEMLRSDFKEIADALGCDVKDNEAMIDKIEMLQGAEPVSNRDELPDGWVMVPVDMPHEMMRAVQVNSELGAYAATNLNGAYSLFREFWDVAVTAAPQQEVK